MTAWTSRSTTGAPCHQHCRQAALIHKSRHHREWWSMFRQPSSNRHQWETQGSSPHFTDVPTGFGSTTMPAHWIKSNHLTHGIPMYRIPNLGGWRWTRRETIDAGATLPTCWNTLGKDFRICFEHSYRRRDPFAGGFTGWPPRQTMRKRSPACDIGPPTSTWMNGFMTWSRPVYCASLVM